MHAFCAYTLIRCEGLCTQLHAWLRYLYHRTGSRELKCPEAYPCAGVIR